jgi:hypothetical protein
MVNVLIEIRVDVHLLIKYLVLVGKRLIKSEMIFDEEASSSDPFHFKD